MKQLTITIPDNVFDDLRVSSIHRKIDTQEVAAEILKRYYQRKKDD